MKDDYDQRISAIGPTILLSTGRYFSFLEPTYMTPEEVAHALAKLCRFTGHCTSFYSVAQHSVFVADLLPDHLKLWGLVHDAVEAVVGDCSGPLKRLIPEYKVIEDRCEKVILEGFGLRAENKPAEVKRADLVALRTEQRDLMNAAGHVWTCLEGIEPSPTPIYPWRADYAQQRWLSAYYEFGGK